MFRRSLRLIVIAAIAGTSLPIVIATPAFANHLPVLVWTDSWNGPTNHQDHAEAVCMLEDGAFIVAGRTFDTSVGERLTLIRYDTKGNIAWSTVEAGPLRIRSMIRSATGDLLIAGYAANSEIFVRRVSPIDGKVIWHKTHAAQFMSEGFGPNLAEDVSAVRGGLTTGEALVAATHNNDFLVVRYALSDGALINTHTFDGPRSGIDVATAVAPLPGPRGGFVVAGPQDSNLAGGYRTIAYAADGSVLWSDHEHGPIGSVFTPAWLGVDGEGNVLVGGGPETPCGLFEARVWKIDPFGKRVWTTNWPSDCCCFEPTDFALDIDGSVVMSGHASTNGVNSDIGAIRVDPAGSVWGRTWDAPGSTTDFGVAVAIDPEGSVIVAGRASAAFNNIDFGVVGWSSAGDLLFARNDPIIPGAVHDLPADIALDGTTGFAIVGSGFAPPENDNALIAWYTRPPPPAPGDANGDGGVDVDDLVAIILAWGPCPPPPTAGDCPADLDHSGSVDVDDLVLVILNWS